MYDEETKAPVRRPLLYAAPFLLALTVLSGLVSELVAMLLRATGWRDVLWPPLVLSLPVGLAALVMPYLVIRLVYRSTLREFGIRWIDPARPWVGWLAGTSVVNDQPEAADGGDGCDTAPAPGDGLEAAYQTGRDEPRQRQVQPQQVAAVEDQPVPGGQR